MLFPYSVHCMRVLDNERSESNVYTGWVSDTYLLITQGGCLFVSHSNKATILSITSCIFATQEQFPLEPCKE